MSTDDHANEQPSADHAPTQHYEICVRGHLESRWTTWFDGMSLTARDDGTTVISGPVVDQAALHGLLQRLRDLGITLLSLSPLVTGTAIEQPDDSHNQTDHHAPGATS
ncbi:MAG: hypothetical protein ABW328_03595 [Ilumatobacteraceae bacterium]